jgi:hypothetical protein
VKLQLHPSSILALDGSEWLTSYLDLQGKRPWYPFIERWMGLRAGLVVLERRKISLPW